MPEFIIDPSAAQEEHEEFIAKLHDIAVSACEGIADRLREAMEVADQYRDSLEGKSDTHTAAIFNTLMHVTVYASRVYDDTIRFPGADSFSDDRGPWLKTMLEFMEENKEAVDSFFEDTENLTLH